MAKSEELVQKSMKINVQTLVGHTTVQNLLESFHAFSDIPIGIFDNEGNLLLKVGEVSVCERFFKVHEASFELCKQSCAVYMPPMGKDLFSMGKCLNGLHRCTGAILLEDKLIGHLLLGPFLLEGVDEKPDHAFLEKAGVNIKELKTEYKRIPVLTNARAEKLSASFLQLVQVIIDLVNEKTHAIRQGELIQKKEEELKVILKSIGDGVIAIDRKGQVSYANPVACRILGFSESEIIGKQIDDLLCVRKEGFEEVIPLPWQEVLLIGHKKDIENVYAKHGNERRYLYVDSMSQIYEAGHRVSGVVLVMRDETARVEADRALRESEKRYRLLAENSSDVIWVLDLSTMRYSYISPAIKKLRGLSVEEAMNEPIEQALHPEDYTRIMQKLPVRIQDFMTERPEIMTAIDEVRQPCKDGSWIWVEMSTTLYKNDEGVVTGVVGVSRDITLRKRDKSSLFESQRFFKAIFSHAGIGMAITNQKGEFLQVNNSFCRIFQYTESELKHMLFERLYYPGDENIVVPLIQKLENGQVEHFELEKRYYRKDGQVLWTILNMALVKNEQGKPLYYISQIQEITQRKQAEIELKESEERLRAIFNASQKVGFIISSIEEPYAVIEFSPGAANMFDIAINEIKGQSPELFIPSKSVAEVYGILNAVVSSKKEFFGETKLLRRNGEAFDAYCTVYPVMNAYGAPIAILAVIIDISSVKSAQEVICQLNENLKEKNRELEQVIYVTSHDLRSPLVNIQGFSRELENTMKELQEMMETMPLDVQSRIHSINSDIQESLHFILGSTRKMDKLLAGLLQFSRLGKQIPEMREVDMNKLLDDVLSNFEFQIKSKNIRVIKTDIPFVWGDKGMLNQAISNVVSNAIKYLDHTREGLIEIEGSEEGSFVVLSIRDNGIGIESKFFDKIFELFHRAHPYQLDGDGLGLSVVKKILEMNSGKIKVESEPGVGSCFRIYLQKPEQVNPSESNNLLDK